MEYFATSDRGVLNNTDIQTLRIAFRLAILNHGNTVSDIDPESLGRAIIRLYGMGLVDAEKLATTAVMLTTSKAFR